MVQEGIIMLIEHLTSRRGTTFPVTCQIDVASQHHHFLMDHVGINGSLIPQHMGAQVLFSEAEIPHKGCLPLVLLFDLQDDVEVSPTKLAQIMDSLDVFISVKPKPRQLSRSVIVKSVEKNASNAYKARRLLLGIEGNDDPSQPEPKNCADTAMGLPLSTAAKSNSTTLCVTNSTLHNVLNSQLGSLQSPLLPWNIASSNNIHALMLPPASQSIYTNFHLASGFQHIPTSMSPHTPSPPPGLAFPTVHKVPTPSEVQSHGETATLLTSASKSVTCASAAIAQPAGLLCKGNIVQKNNMGNRSGLNRKTKHCRGIVEEEKEENRGMEVGRQHPYGGHPLIDPDKLKDCPKDTFVEVGMPRFSGHDGMAYLNGTLTQTPKNNRVTGFGVEHLEGLSGKHVLGSSSQHADASESLNCPTHSTYSHIQTVDYEQKKILATKAMRRKPVVTEVRVPTNLWSGLGFSKSMPSEAMKLLRQKTYKPRMATTYEVDKHQRTSLHEGSNGSDSENWRNGCRGTSSGSNEFHTPSGCTSHILNASPVYDNIVSSDAHLALPSCLNVKSHPAMCSLGTLPHSDVADLPELFSKLSLEKYIEVFHQQEVDLHMFLTLSDQDLKELGVNTFGARRKMLLAISDQKKMQRKGRMGLLEGGASGRLPRHLGEGYSESARW
uniref:protein bicaudal C homolog 1-A-like n=1 Tax=Myxine glutinosa TaxID=7769 RepID=UPI00358E8B8B